METPTAKPGTRTGACRMYWPPRMRVQSRPTSPYRIAKRREFRLPLDPSLRSLSCVVPPAIALSQSRQGFGHARRQPKQIRPITVNIRIVFYGQVRFYLDLPPLSVSAFVRIAGSCQWQAVSRGPDHCLRGDRIGLPVERSSNRRCPHAENHFAPLHPERLPAK